MRGTRRADIQGLRALAVAIVVLFHSGLALPGGYAGVDVFFVISGFVITRMLLAELARSGSISLRSFYSRRIRRLLPALAVVLAAICVGSFLFQSEVGNAQSRTSGVGMAASVFSANVAQFRLANGGYFALTSLTDPLLHTWTLAVEEQFYLVFPLLLIACHRLARRRSATDDGAVVAVVVGGVCILSFALAVTMVASAGMPFGNLARNRTAAFYLLPTRMWEFGVGALLAVLEPKLARGRRGIAVISGVVGLALVGYAAWSFDATTTFPGVPAIVPCLGAALMIGAGTATGSGVTAILAIRPLQKIGDLSYGWYLWHWPVIVYARALSPGIGTWQLVGVAVLSLVPTWLSYRFVENPLRFDRRMVGANVVRLGLTCMIVPIVLFTALRITSRHPGAAVLALRDQNRPHLDVTRGCEGDMPEDVVTRTRCTWTVPGATGHVYLLGDSHAGQFAEPAIAAARRAHLDLTLATWNGCPFADLTLHSPSGVGICNDFIVRWTSYLSRQDDATVVIASRSGEYLHDSGLRFEDPQTHSVASTTADKARVWTAGLRRTLSRIAAHGNAVDLVATVPQFPGFDLRSCPSVDLWWNATGCGRVRSRSAVDAQLRVARSAEAVAVRDLRGARQVTFIDDLCSSTSCSTSRGSLWLYRDGSHLSVAGAMTLTPQFERLFSSGASR